jgi:hypothetical protein
VRSRFLGRATGLVALLLLLTAAASPAGAVERRPLPTRAPAASPSAAPTGGVGTEPSQAPALVFDGVLAVRFMTVDGEPLARAQVIVKAFPASGVAFAARMVTNSNGVATFTGLPRPGDDTPLIWIVEATRRVVRVAGRCTTVIEYSGSAEALAAAGARGIPVFAERVTESQSCGAQPTRPPNAGGGNNAPRPGGNPTGGESGGGRGGSAPENPGLTPPATNTETTETPGSAPIGALLILLALASGALLRLVPRRN